MLEQPQDDPADPQDEILRQNRENTRLIRKGLASPAAKKALDLLKAHFNFHITSAALANFHTNQTFYQDGSKAVFLTIDQILTMEE